MGKEKLLKKIKKEMPEHLDELEIARYIYIKLAKEKSFDKKYYFGTSEDRKKIYMLAQKDRSNFEKLSSEKCLVCYSLSYLYKKILKEFGISSIVSVPSDVDEHVYNIIYLKDGRKIKADITLDLYKINAGLSTTNFGNNGKNGDFFDIIDPVLLEYIDKKIKYISEERNYKNNEIETIEHCIYGKPLLEQLDFILNDEIMNELEDSSKSIEIYRYYYNIMRRYFSNKVLASKIYFLTAYRKNEETKEKEYNFIIYGIDEKAKRIYLYCEKSKKFCEKKANEMNKIIAEQGWKIRNENGSTLFHKYLNESKEQSINER